MRWKDKYIEPYDGYSKIIKKFLLLPKSIQGEVRWLEKVAILRVYNVNRYTCSFVDREWIDCVK